MLSHHSDTTSGSSSSNNAPAPPQFSPQQQTARMLALCEAQMEAATQDSDSAVDILVNAFTDLMALVQEMNAAATTSTDDSATSINRKPLSPEAVKQRCLTLTNQVTAAIVAFQFYDKLSQRLGHVRYSLSTLALFICDRMNSQKPEHWEKLLTTLGRLYRTTEERAIFDSIAGSLSLTSSTEKHRPMAQGNAAEGSIELF